MAEETATQETTQDNGAAQETGPPDIHEALQSLDQKWDSRFSELSERLPEQQQEETRSLTDLLTDDPDEPTYEELMAQYGEEPGADEVDPVRAELDALKSYLIDKEEKERTGSIDSLEQEYPDIRDHLPAIADEIDRIADELGGDVPLTPSLVKLAYKSIKADAASASETPAEEARKRGASLETEAGAGQASEESEDENIMRQIATVRDSQSVF